MRIRWILVSATAALLCAPAAAGAATITVDTSADVLNNGDGLCSLREAVNAANINASNATECTDGDPAPTLDTITLGSQQYSLTIAPAGADSGNHEGDLNVSGGPTAGPLKIEGNGPGQSQIVGVSNGERVIDNLTTLELESIRIVGGDTPGNGGGVRSQSNPLTLDDVEVNGNTAAGAGGAIHASTGLTLENGTSIEGNTATTGPGGGVRLTSSGSLVMSNTVVSGNSAPAGGGGGIAINNPGGNAVIAGAVISGNQALSGGGLQMTASAARSLTMDDTLLFENAADSDSAGTSAIGGGIELNTAGGSHTITRSVISGNVVDGPPAGGGSDQASGGGIHIANSIESLSLRRSEIAGNTITGSANSVAGAGIRTSSSTTIWNSTISGNENDGTSSVGQDYGGGIAADGNAIVDMVHATLNGNSAPTGDEIFAGQITIAQPATVLIAESAIAGTADACETGTNGNIASTGDNVDGSGDCATGGPNDLVGDPDFRPLADNGGPAIGPNTGQTGIPRTHAIPVGSPAENHIPPIDCTEDGTAAGVQDQRGFPRPFDTDCDAGAYEMVEPCLGEGATFVGTSGPDTITVGNGATAGNDVISSLGGADTIDAGEGDDLICAGDDSDPSIDPGPGDDGVDGGGGVNGGVNDTVTYEDADTGVEVSLTAGTGGGGSAGSDTLENVENVEGSPFDDILTGNAHPNGNELEGGDGDDLLNGRGGGIDVLDGGADEDTAAYPNAASPVTANLGLGTAADDGEASSDVLTAIENLSGSSFADTLSGDAGPNVLSPGADSADDVLDGMGGIDTASFAGGTAVTASLDTGSSSGQGSDSLTAIENLVGTNGADVLTGDAGPNRIDGGDGDDSVEGLGGDDVLEGGGGAGDRLVFSNSTGPVSVQLEDGIVNDDGLAPSAVPSTPEDTVAGFEDILGSPQNDYLEGSDGVANELDGSGGNDILEGRTGNDTIIGGPGQDTASFFLGGGVTASLITDTASGQGDDTMQDIEGLQGSNLSADTLIGDEQNNVLEGRGGGDILIGNGGDDFLFGHDPGAGPDGHNILIGGEGDDQLLGAAGPDTVSFPGAAPVTVDLRQPGPQATGRGNDTLDPATIENVVGGDGNDTLKGNQFDNVLNGGGGSDTVDFFGITSGVNANLATGVATGDASVADTLTAIENLAGTAHPDQLTGDAGPNLLAGGDGGDILNGGGGIDQLLGQAGGDSLLLRDGGFDAGDCGPGADSAQADLPGVDLLTACESVDFLAPAVAPPVTEPNCAPLRKALKKAKNQKRKAKKAGNAKGKKKAVKKVKRLKGKLRKRGC